ncbi:hypothetical protein PQX77_006676 [Marasmius sp. AFHP31]|nr:hypothetical protein PQX77_006676 [Marasmius sp. AFHP31]
MFDRNGRQATDKEVLNWGGSKDPNYAQRRADAGCRGFCAEVNSFLPFSMRQECDEYPPASTKQGGAGASRKCIPWYQNSGTQGNQIRTFAGKNRCNLQDNDRFIVRMKDGCSYLGLSRRQNGASAVPTSTAVQDSSSSMSLSGFNDTLSSVAGDDTVPRWISVQFGELQAGDYTISVPLQSVITEPVVLDGEGVEYASIESPNGAVTLTFTLADNITSGASLIAVTNQKMNISFTATARFSTNSGASFGLRTTTRCFGHDHPLLLAQFVGIGIWVAGTWLS